MLTLCRPGHLEISQLFSIKKPTKSKNSFFLILLCINSAHDKLGTNRLQISYRLIKWHEKTWNSLSISSYLLLKWPLFITPYCDFSRGRQSTFHQVLKKFPHLDSNLQPNEWKSNTLSAGLYSHASVDIQSLVQSKNSALPWTILNKSDSARNRTCTLRLAGKLLIHWAM